MSVEVRRYSGFLVGAVGLAMTGAGIWQMNSNVEERGSILSEIPACDFLGLNYFELKFSAQNLLDDSNIPSRELASTHERANLIDCYKQSRILASQRGLGEISWKNSLAAGLPVMGVLTIIAGVAVQGSRRRV